MTWVLADVGGTNVRMATTTDLRHLTNIRRFRNDDFASFDAVLEAYMRAPDPGKVEGLCIAVAGPGTPEKARLTNRDWHFDAARLGAAHGGAKCVLMNDLSALGYALHHLDSSDVHCVIDAPAAPAGGQQLVVGVGTGFNVSPVISVGGQVHCLKAEAGLASLPTRVLSPLMGYLGHHPEWAFCVENALSGPGLARLHAQATGQTVAGGNTVTEAAADGDVAALRSLDVFAAMLGEMVQDLRLNYMPTDGIFLAGSVLRGVMASPARARFEDVLSHQPTQKNTLPQVPVSLIVQDEVALHGCLAYASGLT